VAQPLGLKLDDITIVGSPADSPAEQEGSDEGSASVSDPDGAQIADPWRGLDWTRENPEERREPESVHRRLADFRGNPMDDPSIDSLKHLAERAGLEVEIEQLRGDFRAGARTKDDVQPSERSHHCGWSPEAALARAIDDVVQMVERPARDRAEREGDER
jgi:hypothetical protein